jgi:DNA polymerase/3'-5' exonuclease PolX
MCCLEAQHLVTSSSLFMSAPVSPHAAAAAAAAASAHSCTELPPSDTEAYLVGCLPGVGPKTAALLVQGLGRDHVREALSSSDALDQLRGIKGIGARKAAEIKHAWDKNTGAQIRSTPVWFVFGAMICCGVDRQ